MASVLATCDRCGQRRYVQAVWIGSDEDGSEQNRCQHCAGDKWRPEYLTPELHHVLDRVEEFLESRADCDHDVEQGELVQYANEEARLLADLRAARGES